MRKLIDEIMKDRNWNISGIKGYAMFEILKMESFYNIKISGDLRRFFSEIGRSSGDIKFDAFVIPYSGYYSAKTPANISGHVATQLDFRADLLKFGRAFRTGNPFLFSIEGDTQYYFLRTRSDEPLRGVTPEDNYSQLSKDPEIVYHYDENENSVENTGILFKDYLSARLQENSAERSGAGEMIVI